MDRRLFLGLLLASSVNLAFSNEIKESSDIFLAKSDEETFNSVLNKLRAIQKHVGYANFSLISFDDVLLYAKRVSKIEAFEKKELDLIEKLFYDDVNQYGFYGKRTCYALTEVIKRKDVVKIPKTGQYVFKGEPLKAYYRVIKDVGPSLTLTSGVRSVSKQLSLFMEKINFCNGNISLASKSLAPPGFSYHSISDFDVGKKGWGAMNFTEKFALTEEFYKLRKLKYISMRYKVNNKDGVRFEPWHVQIG